jgi:ABC-type multidrug transport system fused ATPase/permease subunit
VRPTGLIGLFRPLVGDHRWLLASLAVTSTLSGFIEAALLFVIVSWAVGIASGDGDLMFDLGPAGAVPVTMSQTMAVAAALIVLALLVAFLNARTTARIWSRVTGNLRKSLQAAYLHASGETQYAETAGHLQDVMSTSIGRVSQGVLSLTGGITAGLQFTALMAAAAVVDITSTLLLVAAVAVLSALLRPVMSLTRRKGERTRSAGLDHSVRVAETVALAREIRAFDVTVQTQSTLESSVDEVSAAGYSSRLIAGLTPNIFRSLLLGMVVAGLGAISAVGIADVANLGAVVLLAVRSLAYAQAFNSHLQQMTEMGPYLKQVQDLEGLYLSSPMPRDGDVLGPILHLRCEGLSYSYSPGRPALSQVTWELSRGQSLGIVGPSGGGKSTLVQLLLRLRLPHAGALVVNGRNATSFDRSSWARRVVFVPQQNHLLRGTVGENIRFLRPGFDDTAVVDAARRAHVHEDIQRLPQGYATVVGSGARDLSGGQLQRLGIARALLGNPDVLILDEPTSALDMHSEALIQQTLEELHGRVMLIIVAHRLSTISYCDQILVLEDGRVTASGMPSEVAQHSRFYREALSYSRPAG